MFPSVCDHRPGTCGGRMAYWLPWLAAFLTGCSALHRRNAVPEHAVGGVHPPGYSNIRDWGDHFSPVLQQSVETALRQEAAAGNPYGGTPIQYLSLSGGGMNGAFGAGLLCGWSVHGTRPNFDFVTGISAGALLAPFAFLGPSYDPALREIFARLDPASVYRRKGLLRIVRDDSVYDTSPLRKTLERHITPELLAGISREHGLGRRLWIGTVNLDARRPVIWDMGAIASSGRPDAPALFIKVMMASAAIPGAFPPAYFEVSVDGTIHDELHVDGGVSRQAFAYGPVLHLEEIRRRLAMLGPSRKAELYVIRNGELGTQYSPVRPRALPILMNSLRTVTHYQAEGDLYRMFVFAGRDACDYNLTGIPPGYRPLSTREFDHGEMERLFALGEAMGRAGGGWVHHPWDEVAPPAGRP